MNTAAKPTPHNKIIWTVNPNVIEGDEIDKNANSPVRIMWILLLVVFLLIVIANLAYRWKQSNKNFYSPSVVYQRTFDKITSVFKPKGEINERLWEVSEDGDSASLVGAKEFGTEL